MNIHGIKCVYKKERLFKINGLTTFLYGCENSLFIGYIYDFLLWKSILYKKFLSILVQSVVKLLKVSIKHKSLSIVHQLLVVNLFHLSFSFIFIVFMKYDIDF